MEENNIIIAKFMGKDLPYINNKGNWEYFVKDAGLINSPNIKDINKFLNFNYNSDWNWLMEVVEKIENTKIKDYSISTDITDNKTLISIWHYGDGSKWSILISNLNEEYKDFNKIQRTYKAIIEFINFYNKQKEE